MNNETIKTIGVVVFVLAVTVGVWWTKRTINYSLNYGGQVEEDIKTYILPLEKRIIELEKQVKLLQIKK